MKDFRSFNNRVFITAEFTSLTPLRVGRGVSLEPVGTDLPVLKTPEGLPVIPGSSVKGVVRSELERIIRTLESQGYDVDGEPLRVCIPFEGDEQCINKDEKDKLVAKSTQRGKLNEEKFTQLLWEKSCTVCRLFGSPWLASRVNFGEMTMIVEEGRTPHTEIRDGVAIDRDTGTAKQGLKYDYEVVPAGARFHFSMVMENVEDWEVGLVGLVLRAWEHSELALGGKVSGGLGRGRLENLRIQTVDREGILDYLIEGKKQEKDLDYYLKALKGKLKRGGE